MTTTVSFTELHPKQTEVYEHPARFKVLAAGRRWGKTRLGVVACMETAGRDGGLAWWIAPTYKDTDPGWLPMRAIAMELPDAEVREGDRTIRFGNGGAIMVRSADDPHERGLRGHALDLAVLDEAAQFQYPDAWTHAIRPALADRGGKALIISTPRGYNWFYDLYQAGQGDDANWESWQLPTETNPLFDTDELVDAKRELGSLAYSQEFLAEFIQAGGNRYKPEWFHTYTPVDEHHISCGGEVVDMRQGFRFATVDLAVSVKESADYTVIASCVGWRNRLVVLDVVRERMEGPDIVKRIRNRYQTLDLDAVYIESVGTQLTFVQEAKRAGLPVKELDARGERGTPAKIARSIALESRMEAGEVWFPNGADWLPDLRVELLAFTGTGQDRHDDQVDALAYAAKVLTQELKPRSRGLSGNVLTDPDLLKF